MKTHDFVQNGIVFLLLTVVTALPSLAQDSTSGKPTNDNPDKTQMMTTMMELAKPGENHKLLEGLAGSWTYTSKFWFNPDTNTPPMESSGKATAKTIMGGRYLQTDNTGNMTGMEFQGREIAGYDNVKKKFVSSWIDNMGTGIMLSEGTYDPATKTITYKSEYEPMPGMKTKVRETLKVTDNDHHTFSFYENRDGHEMKTMEVICTREK